jgi:hypothetical protein
MTPTEAERINRNRASVNLEGALRDAIADAQRIESGLRRYLDRIERLLTGLYKMEVALRQSAGRSPLRAVRAVRFSADGPVPAALSCQLVESEGGGTALRIDGAEPLPLTKTLAVLVAVLVSSDGQSADELVAWKPFNRIGELLEKRLGRGFGSRAVSQLLWRLRGAFDRAGLDPRLIETKPAHGGRLRLKRTSAGLWPS